MDMERIKRALPKEGGQGRRSTIRMRSDVAEVVVDCVLNRRPYLEIAKRCAVDVETLVRFRKKFITEEVKRIVLVEDQKAEAAAIDTAINEGQDEIQSGLRSIIAEQKKIIEQLKDNEDLGGALMGLRDQGATYERLLKSYTALKERTTIVLSINENPEWSRLQNVLRAVFANHPDAFDDFQRLARQERLRLE
jgi:hypothetical protein